MIWRRRGFRDPVSAGELRGLLAANELFRDMDAGLVADIAEMTRTSTCVAGQRVYGPGSESETLFLLKRGRVQVYRLTGEGKKLVVHEVRPGTFFGEMSLLGQGVGGTFAEATEDSLICALSRVDVRQILAAHPEVATRVIEHLAERLRMAEMRLEGLAYDRLDARLATVLLREADEAGYVTGLSQQELGELVGATRESVTRQLNEMSKRGLVEVSRRRLRLLDREAIRALLRPS